MKKIYIYLSILILSSCTHIIPVVKVPDNPPAAKPLKDIKVALVLGGGGGKAIAQLGVLEVLEKNRIPIDLIVGTSAGSAIGALYADNPNIEAVTSKVMNINKKELLDTSVLDSAQMLFDLKGPIRGLAFERFLVRNLQAKNLEELKIPLVVVTVDIEKNKMFNLRTGPIAPAVHASSAIPPFFTPVNIYKRKLVDGGVIAPVPVKVAQEFNPKMIIAVDISAPPSTSKVGNMLTLTYRSIEIFYYELARMQGRTAHIDIHPELDGHGMFDDHRKQDLYEAGKKAALEQLPIIKRKMMEMNIPFKGYSNKKFAAK